MKPFFQGKLDLFCAIYAVLNGLKLTHHIRTLEAREIFNETLLGLAPNQEALRAVLYETTDYIALVDGMLRIQGHKRLLRVHTPFVPVREPLQNTVAPAEVWDCIRLWLGGDSHRAVVFRFLRHMAHDAPPTNRHWTTGRQIVGDRVDLFDCSYEESALRHIERHGFVTRPDAVDKKRLVCIEPHSIRLLGQVLT